ncbi:MAG: hypothetical protein H6728_08400 [Myxococcales bacterium]|nr:hypothetical protein [Myxococcales bacterium]MCB9643080.1 hypothetical protein [Myxococcales bacterium]
MQRYYYMIQYGGRYALGQTHEPQKLVETDIFGEEPLRKMWLYADEALSLAERNYLERLSDMAEETSFGFELALSEAEFQRIQETLQKKANQEGFIPPSPDSPDMAPPPPPPMQSPVPLASPIPTSLAQGQLSFLDAKAQVNLPTTPKSSGGSRNHPTIDAWPDPMAPIAVQAQNAANTTAPYHGQQETLPHALPLQQGTLQQSLLGLWQRGQLLSLQKEPSGDLFFSLEDHETLARLIKVRDWEREQEPHAADLFSPVDLLLAAVQAHPPNTPQYGQSFFIYQPIHLYRRLFGSWLPDESAQEIHALLSEQIDAEECFLCLGRPFRQGKIGHQRGEMGVYRGEITRCWVIPLLQDPSADLFEKLIRDTKVRCSLYDEDIGTIGEMSFFFRLLHQLGLSPRILIEEMEGIIPFDSLCRLLEVDRPHISQTLDSDDLLPQTTFEEEDEDDF